MGWDGSGNFNRSDGTRSGTQVWQDAAAAGVKILAEDHDTHDEDIADGLENTVAKDGQNTTTTDNAILRFDSGNTAFEGVSISASQIVGRAASGDVKGLSAATARQTIGVGSAAPTNNQFIYWASASSQYVQATAATARSLIGLGTASPTKNQALFYTSASSSYEQKSAASARTLLGVFAAPSSSSDPGLAFDTWRTPNANKATLVTVTLQVVTNGSTNGVVRVEVDESGGTTKDYDHEFFIHADLSSGTTWLKFGPCTFLVPAGGSYQIDNVADPASTNSIDSHREWTL